MCGRCAKWAFRQTFSLRAIGLVMATRTRGAAATTTPLERELEQARNGNHPRQIAESKRLEQMKISRLQQADQLRKYRLSIVEAQFESERRAAEEVFAREKGIVQNRLIEEVIDRQKRHSKVDKSEQSAVTRKMRQLRGEVAPPIKPKSARDAKTSLTSAIPLQMGQVEEDFEVMATDMAKYAPNLDIDLELEVAPNKRLRPVEAVRPSVRLDGPPPSGSGKRKRGDFDFKGKSRAEVSGARITVWYEEEDKHGRKVDVPYIGIVKSCDPREGLYVQFDSYEDQEMLITNEDDWRWGSHSGGRKPPESRFTR